LTWSTNVTDGRTNRQTPHDSIDRACIASRGKNAWQHVPVYLRQFPCYSNHNCEKIAIFTYPSLHFLFALETPLWQSRKTLHESKDNSVLAKPLAACTHLSATVSQLFEPQVQKIAVFTYRTLADPGVETGGHIPNPSLLLPFPFRSPFPFLPPLPFSVPPLLFISPPLPLEVGPIKSSYRVWGSAVSSPSGVWGRAPAEIDFGAF